MRRSVVKEVFAREVMYELCTPMTSVANYSCDERPGMSEPPAMHVKGSAATHVYVLGVA